MNRSDYSSADADYWYNKGKEDERAKIVAWLCYDPWTDMSHHIGYDIEARKHYVIEAEERLK
jgi:hypothetical protein